MIRIVCFNLAFSLVFRPQRARLDSARSPASTQPDGHHVNRSAIWILVSPSSQKVSILIRSE